MTVPFDELAEDFLAFTADIVYCTVTTVDGDGRPRSRVMHPVFEVAEGRPRGWAVTDRSPVKTRHLARNPHLCCSYWSPAHNTVTGTAEPVGRGRRDEAVRLDLFRDTPPPLGWGDLGADEPERIAHPLFHPLRLTPWRVQVLRAEQLAAGDYSPRTWRAAPSTAGAPTSSTA